MAQTAQRLTEDQVPAGGIADFVMTDEELEALEAEEAKEEFGTAGIANFEEVAKRMASYGRFGDDTVAHVETGELLVPRALIEDNPKLKESIFNHLREMGVEDPERYVVGSSANSINPETGLPEFFLKKVFKTVKKGVSKVVKGVKKAFKAVGKILKKVAPVVLPIALAMTPLGAVYGAALGSGIGTLIQGGSLKDAFKSALVSGAIGGVTAGFTGNTGSFTGNVKAAFADPAGRLAQTGAGIGRALDTGSVGQAFGSYAAPIEGAGIPEGTNMDQLIGKAGTTPADVQQAAMQPSNNLADASLYGEAYGANIPAQPNVTGGNYSEAMLYDQAMATGQTVPSAQAPTVIDQTTGNVIQTGGGAGASTGATGGAEKSFFDTMGDYADKAKGMYNEYLSPSRDMGQKTMTQALAEVGATPQNATLAQVEMAKEIVSKSAPGFIQAYGPLAAVGAGAAYLGGAFEAAPQEDPNLVQRNADGSVTTGEDLIALNPDEYMIQGDPRYSSGQYAVGTNYGLTRQGQMYRNPFARPQMYAAAGGEVYPRRNGGIMPNEGIPDQDSVRALLMPGEFVMTKDAVRGLGGGSMNQGINNMYSLMRNLESKGRAA